MPISYVGGRTDAFQGTSSARAISLTTLTGGSDSAPQAGDLVVLFYGTGSNVTTGRTLSVSTADYQALTQQLGSDTYDTHFNVFYKRMGSTPDTSVTVSGTGSTADAGTVVIHVFRGVDETTPLDVSAVPASGNNSANANPPAITPTTSGAWIVAGGSAAHADGVDTFTSTDLSNFRTAGADDNYDVTIGAGTAEWSSGAFDPAQFGWTGTASTANSWAAYTLALRPDGLAGTADGWIDLTGSSVGSVRAAGQASGSLDISGQATASALYIGSATFDDGIFDTDIFDTPLQPVDGAAAGSIGLGGSSTGAVRIAGASSGTLPLAGAGAGAVRVAGAAAGTLPIIGASTGRVLLSAQASGQIGLTGQATGIARAAGTGAGQIDITGQAAGIARSAGQASGTLPLAGSGAGAVRVAGAVAGAISLTGASTGQARVAAQASGLIDLTGTALGRALISGQASGDLPLTGSAVGSLATGILGVAAGVLDLTGTATGTVEGSVPSVGLPAVIAAKVMGAGMNR
jgi:hypothetical protein